MSGSWFGLPKPEHAEVAWGARAILERVLDGRYRIDILWDRQQLVGNDVRSLIDSVNHQKDRLDSILIKFPERDDERWAYLSLTDGRSVDVVAIDRGDFHLRVSPNKSHGYLYMVAWVGEVGDYDQQRIETWGGEVVVL